MEWVFRFLVGGAIVSLFSACGDLFQPKSFAGLFCAAPSVALATLGMAFAQGRASDAVIEGKAMLAGAVALGLYSLLTAWMIRREHLRPEVVAGLGWAQWLAVALGLWAFVWRT